jgi:hypothetical protein
LELARSTDKGEQLALRLELRRINEMLAERNKELYGPSRSERRGRPEDEKDEPKPKAKGHGPNKQERLPKTEVLHVRGEAAQPCGACQQPQPAMAGQTEDTELITIIERKVVLCVHKRQK